jgi:RecT family protein
VALKPPRLPYHEAVEERFGIDRAGWKALVEAIYPNAETADAIVMALSYCRARNLDPFKRPVHIVPMWSSVAGKMIETVWPGISELRTTAFRTGQYAGMPAPDFGPTIERTFKGVNGGVKTGHLGGAKPGQFAAWA